MLKPKSWRRSVQKRHFFFRISIVWVIFSIIPSHSFSGFWSVWFCGSNSYRTEPTRKSPANQLSPAPCGRRGLRRLFPRFEGELSRLPALLQLLEDRRAGGLPVAGSPTLPWKNERGSWKWRSLEYYFAYWGSLSYPIFRGELLVSGKVKKQWRGNSVGINRCYMVAEKMVMLSTPWVFHGWKLWISDFRSIFKC